MANNNVYLNHNVDLFDLEVDAKAGIVLFEGRQGYKTKPVGIHFSALDRTEPGDSGGAVFSEEGYLVGINLGVSGWESVFCVEYTHYFVPLR
ncbi:MAG: hypothetical protein JXB47_05690 [Anaerolineae bacterium]|nr:hypothetical protein [Anaerolineae bacterium]